MSRCYTYIYHYTISRTRYRYSKHVRTKCITYILCFLGILKSVFTHRMASLRQLRNPWLIVLRKRLQWSSWGTEIIIASWCDVLILKSFFIRKKVVSLKRWERKKNMSGKKDKRTYGVKLARVWESFIEGYTASVCNGVLNLIGHAECILFVYNSWQRKEVRQENILCTASV